MKPMLMLELNNKKTNGKTKLMKDGDYGFYENGSIMINIEKIFNSTQVEEGFITMFSQVVLHELLHMVIEDVVDDQFLVGEEKLVRKLCNEPWNKKIEAIYLKDAVQAC